MRTRVTLLLLSTAALVAAIVLAADAPPPSPLSYAKDVEPIFLERCETCHGAKRAKGGLDLQAKKGYGNLVGVESPVAKMPLVKPGDPELSVLWRKLDFRPVVGDPMPKRLFFGAKRLPQAELDAVKSWIEQGAKE